MAFCTEVEDVISMSLTAVTSLLEKYTIDPKQIGRFEVGSETVIDKSKSIKTFLMQIFEVYAEGPARPTGGAAAIAMLVGPDAPIVFESKFRGSHMYEKLEGKQFSISDADYIVFHSPYNKLVQKSFARLLFNDFMRNASSVDDIAKEKLSPFSNLIGDESYHSRDLEKVSQQVSKSLYDAKVQPTTLIPKQVGNMYTTSLYAAFASLIHNKHSELAGKRVILFSYGSGLTSTMFSLRLHEGQHPFSLSNIATVMNVAGKLKWRHEFPPEKFVQTMKLMEHRYGAKDFVMSKDCGLLSPGTYYLTEVDSMYRRFYSKKDGDYTVCENGSLANGH
ncbi:hypothetical protein Godav_012210 [Gossypium davidsonii]|uniref:Hydroxymethylglutaryl-CoA synthase n=1 Tax=Gossypium davidsonii TaxID=34287 RepID=A0A7J8RDB5_GOSDV|nr:hypothetical protein [Gossypium davidsonii]